MFHPLSVYMGLRYVRSRPHKFFVSFITWASLVGVCAGGSGADRHPLGDERL